MSQKASQGQTVDGPKSYPRLTKRDPIMWRPRGDMSGVGNNGHDETSDGLLETDKVHATRIDHCKCDSDREHGCVCNRL